MGRGKTDTGQGPTGAKTSESAPSRSMCKYRDLGEIFEKDGLLGHVGASRQEGELWEHYIVRAVTESSNRHVSSIERSLARVFASDQMKQVTAYFGDSVLATGGLGAIETLSFGMMYGLGESRNECAQSLKCVINEHDGCSDTSLRDAKLAQKIEDMERQWSRDDEVVGDLATLWERKLGGAKIDGGDFTTAIPEERYMSLGRKLVLEPEVEAYASGVPIEDIIA